MYNLCAKPHTHYAKPKPQHNEYYYIQLPFNARRKNTHTNHPRRRLRRQLLSRYLLTRCRRLCDQQWTANSDTQHAGDKVAVEYFQIIKPAVAVAPGTRFALSNALFDTTRQRAPPMPMVDKMFATAAVAASTTTATSD